MYAVFKTGGKQYRATKGERLRVERLEAQEGATVEFEQVLLVGEGSNINVGTPFIAGSKVQAKIILQGRAKKIDVVKFKRRKNYLRLRGHRQFFTEVEIVSITTGPAEKPEKKAATKKAGAKTADIET